MLSSDKIAYSCIHGFRHIFVLNQLSVLSSVKLFKVPCTIRLIWYIHKYALYNEYQIIQSIIVVQTHRKAPKICCFVSFELSSTVSLTLNTIPCTAPHTDCGVIHQGKDTEFNGNAWMKNIWPCFHTDTCTRAHRPAIQHNKDILSWQQHTWT